MADNVMITIAFTVKPEKIDEFGAILAEAFKETRKRPGFLSIRADRHSEQNKILLSETWESMQQYQDYIAWRAARGERADDLAAFLAGPPAVDVWTRQVG